MRFFDGSSQVQREPEPKHPCLGIFQKTAVMSCSRSAIMMDCVSYTSKRKQTENRLKINWIVSVI